MAYFALIKANVVTRLIVADQVFIDQVGGAAGLGVDLVIDVTSLVPRPGPRWAYNPATGQFTAP